MKRPIFLADRPYVLDVLFGVTKSGSVLCSYTWPEAFHSGPLPFVAISPRPGGQRG